MLRHPSRFWQHHQLGFLTTLAAGMGQEFDFRTPDRLYARSRGPCALGVFFGAIAVSVYQIGIARRFRNLWSLAAWVWFFRFSVCLARFVRLSDGAIFRRYCSFRGFYPAFWQLRIALVGLYTDVIVG